MSSAIFFWLFMGGPAIIYLVLDYLETSNNLNGESRRAQFEANRKKLEEKQTAKNYKTSLEAVRGKKLWN